MTPKILLNRSIFRKQARLAEQLRFEKLISKLALGFVNLPDAGNDREIENTLRLVAEFFKVDRIAVFQLSFRQHAIEVIHAYTSEGIYPVASSNPVILYPWCWGKLRRGEIIVIPTLEDLTAEAPTDRANLEKLGVKAFIGVPIGHKSIYRIFLALFCLRKPGNWNPGLIQRVWTVGRLIENALFRRETEADLARMELQSRQFRNDLSHQERVGTISALTTAIAHEINQPLAAILSNAQAAQKYLALEPPDLEEVRLILADIVDDDKRASDVIQNLRTLLRKEKIQTEYFELNKLIFKTTDLITSQAILRDVCIATELYPNLPAVWGNPVQIQQVILNLLVNAMDAIEEMQTKDGRITVSTRTENGWIEVNISDTGPGVPEQTRKAMFKPFYTTKQDGLGIGLTICRSIIESHGGGLYADNLPEGGARFTFRLPIRHD